MLAANTVARTYRELESNGVIATRGRRGTFVHSDTHGRSGSASGPVAAVAADYAETARRAGLSMPEALGLVERAWARG